VKSCKGCKHLVHARTYDCCSAADGPTTERDPYSGRVTTYYGLRPTLGEMRKEGGLCGPDAALFDDRAVGFFGRLFK
jgi:hypothetical protein